MDSLKVSLFYDSAQRDHEFTLLGLEDAYRRAESTVACVRADAAGAAPRGPWRSNAGEDLVAFDAISLDIEFANHPILRDSLFLLDSAVNLAAHPWRGGEWDRLACLERVAAIDVRAWAFFRLAFNREIPLLPAPLAVFRGLSMTQARRMALIHNDLALAHSVGPQIRRALRRLEPDFEIVEVTNAYRRPVRQSDWLKANLLNAAVHVHVGAPPDSVSVGRLIDSMNMRVPCVVFDDAHVRIDSDVPIRWRRPVYVNDVNSVWVSTVKAFEDVARVVLRDRSWAQSLTRNALREVAIFHEQVQKSLLPTKFVDAYLAPAVPPPVVVAP